jgi:hypothetical protein
MFLDPDTAHGDSFEISAVREDRSPLPGWLTFDTETLAFAGTPTDADVGPLNVSIVAKDTQGAEGVDTFLLDVRPESDLPSAPIASVRRVVIPANGRVPVIIDWSAGREADQGRPRYQLDMRTMGKKGWGKYAPLLKVTTRTGTNRFLTPGTYQLRVRATPQGGKAGDWVEGVPFTLAVLQETDPSIDYQGSWSKTPRKDASKGQVRRTVHPGDSFSIPVGDSDVSLIMTTGPDQGIIEACIDPGTENAGACRTVDLSKLRKSSRTVVTTLRDLPPGDHTLVVTAREAPVELDGVALVTEIPTEPAPSPDASPQPAS